MAAQPSVLAIDAGGTYFKSALVDKTGRIIPGSAYTVAVNSQGNRVSILDSYAEVLAHAVERIRSGNLRLTGIGVSTPGPFDIHRGKSYMTHKFQSLYNLDLAESLRICGGFDRHFPIRFVHDAHAFVLGELWSGNGRGFANVAGVTLGTGLGFACFIGGKLLTNDLGGPKISLYQIPFQGGILEDRISARGIKQAYIRAHSPDQPPSAGNLDVKKIAALARTGKDPAATTVFEETAAILANHLVPICKEWKINCLLLGGQISKAFDLLEPGFYNFQGQVPTVSCLAPAANADEAALIGAASRIFVQ